MEFQNTARFGESRVVVTDYDETNVTVESKVLDEDTGEVICESGGGGESDFTLASITVKNESDQDIEIECPLIDEQLESASYTLSIESGNTSPLSVIMYNGKAAYYLILTNAAQLTITLNGDIEPSPMSNAIGSIEGDGCITISNAATGN